MKPSDTSRLRQGALAVLAKAASDGDPRAAAALVAALDRQPPPPAPTPKRRRVPRTRKAHLRRLLADTEANLAAATAAASWQAVAALTRQIVSLRNDLDALKESDPKPKALTETEARERLSAAMAQLPPHDRRELLAFLAGPPKLEVVEGG
jgi:hypothetical protein